jgi:hypothetical protein
MTKKEVLANSNFGARIAEEESDVLESYFVETEQWRKIFGGEIDIVFGPKGSGKSAIYSLLIKKTADLNNRRVILIAAENVRGTPAFKDLQADPPATEEQFRNLWKLYLLSLLGSQIKGSRIEPDFSHVIAVLETAELIEQGARLRSILRRSLDYVRRLDLEGTLKLDQYSGSPTGISGRVRLKYNIN